MCYRHCCLSAGLLFLCLVQLATGAGSWCAIIDAGPSASQLRIFSARKGQLEATTIGNVEPGLTSFLGQPTDALASIEALLVAAAEHLNKQPERVSQPVPLLIRTTAAMRPVPLEQQRALYDQMLTDFSLHRLRLTFNLTIATLTNEQEVFLGFVGANYMGGTLGANMRPLDNPPDFLETVVLGGETMEVAIPPRTWQSTVTAEHVGVRSYIDYGFNATRTRMHSQFTALQMRACDFPKSGNDSATFGSGDAARCRMMMAHSLWPADSCLHPPCGLAGFPKLEVPTGDVWAASLFARSIAAMDVLLGEQSIMEKDDDKLTPSPSEVAASAQTLCSLPYPYLVLTENKVTLNGTLMAPDGHWLYPELCFQVNYVEVIMTRLFGLSRESHQVQYAQSIRGVDIDWLLGLYLSIADPDDLKQPKVSFLEEVGRVWWLVAIAVAVTVAVVVAVMSIFRVCKQRQEYTRLNPDDVETRRGLVPKRRPVAKKTKAEWKRESRDRSRASGIAERSDALEDVGL